MHWPHLNRFWRRLEDAPMPLAVKWSLSIGLLICLGMGLLGWFLITQQAENFRQQSTALGNTIVNQLAHAAGEPLMADDQFSLQILARRGIQDQSILGVAILDAEGRMLAQEGELTATDSAGVSLGMPAVMRFSAEVPFKDVSAGRVEILLDNRPLQASQHTLIKALVSTSAVMILITVLLAFPLARRFCEPIYELMHASEALRTNSPSALPSSERQDEIGRVMHAFQRLSEDLAQKHQVEETLSRHVSADVARNLLSNPEAGRLGGAPVQGSVLFCDIVGFTSLSEDLAPAAIADLLNQYFGHFALAASSCRGTVDKYIGDCVMILFGIPEPDENHALHAVTCALLIQAIAERINQRRRRAGDQALRFRIGINSGEMLAGNLGNAERMQFTVVGDAVNLASRLCALSPPGGVLLSDDTLGEPGVADNVKTEDMEAVQVRGRQKPTVPHLLQGLSDPHLEDLRHTLESIVPTPEHAAA